MKTCPFDKIHNYCSEQECQLWTTKTITKFREPTEEEIEEYRKEYTNSIFRTLDISYEEEVTGCAFTLMATNLIDLVNEEDSM